MLCLCFPVPPLLLWTGAGVGCQVVTGALAEALILLVRKVALDLRPRMQNLVNVEPAVPWAWGVCRLDINLALSLGGVPTQTGNICYVFAPPARPDWYWHSCHAAARRNSQSNSD